MMYNNKNYLTIDASSQLVVEIQAGEKYSRCEKNLFRLDESLFEEIDKLLKESQVGIKDLTGLVVNPGPGSFNALRVALITVKTLAHLLKIPLYCYDGFDLLHYQLFNHLLAKNELSNFQDSLQVLFLKAGKNNFFYSFYYQQQRVSPIKNIHGSQLEKILSAKWWQDQIIQLPHEIHLDSLNLPNASFVAPTNKQVKLFLIQGQWIVFLCQQDFDKGFIEKLTSTDVIMDNKILFKNLPKMPSSLWDCFKDALNKGKPQEISPLKLTPQYCRSFQAEI